MHRASSGRVIIQEGKKQVNILGKALRRIDWINAWTGRILSLFLLLMFALLLMEVIRRYLLNSPTVWANELSQMLFGAYVVLCGGHILASGGHVNVDILFSRLTRKTQAKLDIFTSILFFMFCVMMAYYGGSLAWESLATFERSQSAWNPPVYPIKLTIPLGAGLLLLQGIAKLVRDILIVVKGEDYMDAASQKKDSL
jgi:TRAP-type mannitol/chloroaromatic compound transport system permease small subunit